MKKNIVFDNAIQSIEKDRKIDNFISLSDSPITDEEQDRLKRTCFINNFYGQITSLPFEDSFCFGLYGNWGEGKTSAINLVKKRLHKDKNNIIFEFDPWYLTSKEAILKYFIDELEQKLKLTSKEFKVLKTYFNRINTVGVTILGSGFNAGWRAGQNDILKLKKDVNNLLIRFKKKIFIFIDDIDRLQCDEILLVFKIIKLIGNFKHTIFVLSMDVECVEKTLRNNQVDADFIDKIVQKQIHLPKAEQNDIEQFFMSEIGNLFQNLNIGDDRRENELEQLFIVYKKHLIKQFSTLRDVKRYLNSLSASLPPVVGEVHLLDFLILEIIKVFFPSLYNNIFENWWFYVSARSESDRWINPLLSLVSNDENKCADIIESHVNTILEDHPKRELFLNLLGILFLEINAIFKLYKDFDTVDKDRQSRRIYTTSFLKYFLQRVPNNELSDSLINRIVNSWVEIPPDKLAEEI
jgi:predicted KAP-like P-loop ATPase